MPKDSAVTGFPTKGPHTAPDPAAADAWSSTADAADDDDEEEEEEEEEAPIVSTTSLYISFHQLGPGIPVMARGKLCMKPMAAMAEYTSYSRFVPHAPTIDHQPIK